MSANNPQLVTIASPREHLQADFLPQTGMLCCSLRSNGLELLDSGAGIEAYAQAGKTMGIPLLYPWANRLGDLRYSAGDKDVQLPEDRSLIPTDPNGLPIHGIVPGLLSWKIEQPMSADRLRTRMSWRPSALFALFPFVHDMTYEATVDETAITISVGVHACGADRVPVSFGFHPYLRPSAGRREQWLLKLPPAEQLLLDRAMLPNGERTECTQSTVPLLERSLDEAYRIAVLPASLAAQTAERTISVELIEGYNFAQVYAPADKDFICLEPMTAPADALRSGASLRLLNPGEQHRSTFRIVLAGGHTQASCATSAPSTAA